MVERQDCWKEHDKAIHIKQWWINQPAFFEDGHDCEKF
jgi:hypothetical protein